MAKTYGYQAMGPPAHIIFNRSAQHVDGSLRSGIGWTFDLWLHEVGVRIVILQPIGLVEMRDVQK